MKQAFCTLLMSAFLAVGINSTSEANMSINKAIVYLDPPERENSLPEIS